MSPARKNRRPEGAKRDNTVVDLLRLLEIVSSIPRQTICVVGDLVIDEFVSTEISRVSREAPVLILKQRRSEILPGGGANAANNLATLGARVLLVGFVGDDEGGKRLVEYLGKQGIDVSRVARVQDWVTPRKTRFLAGWTHTTEQQVLRLDQEPQADLPERVQMKVLAQAHSASRLADAVLFSDYGFGAVTPAIARAVKSKCVALDSRFNLRDYARTGVTVATPNEPELEVAYGVKIGNDQSRLDETGKRALEELGVESLVVTRGKDGLAVFAKDERTGPMLVEHIPIFGSDTPVDVAGAGDTVIAAYTAALAAGASAHEAAHLANYAAGIVVMKRRTATVTKAELEAALQHEVTARE